MRALLIAVLLLGQASFDAASVKRNTSGDELFKISVEPGGRFSATNVSLRRLIASAYGTPQPRPESQVLGGPKWLDIDRFDLVAKAAGNPTTQQEVQQLLRALLAERFRLKVHTEDRDAPIYALVVARSDGRLGAQFRPAGECPPARERVERDTFCGIRTAAGQITGRSAVLSNLATTLTRVVERPVQDRTSLTGSFDFTLQWTPDANVSTVSPVGPSIFTALQEQLGLKLESTKGPVNVVVIDHVEAPTPD
jgi:uncharacterized protein (TIGR03435 family)